MSFKDLFSRLDVIAVLGFLIAVETQISNGSMSFAHSLPEAWIPVAKEWAGNLASVGGLLVGVLRMSAGPSTATKQLAMLAVVTVAAMLLFVPSAHAQTKLKPLTGNIAADAKSAATETDAATGDTKCNLIWDPLKLCGALTGKPTEDIQRVVKRIQGIGRDDMNYAILKATAAGTNGAKVRLQCLQAIMDAKNAAEGVGIKDANGNVVPRPDPAFVTTIEDVAELIDGLSPTGPLMTGCAGAAQLFKTNTLAAINAIVTGAAGIAALPAGF